MSVQLGNRGPRRVLLVAVTAAVLGAGGAGVAYASTHNPAVETGYAVVSTQTDPSDQTWTEAECEQWRARQQQGEQPAPGDSAQPSPADSAPSDVTGRL